MPRVAKLFRNGHSQAVRLPAEFRFEGDEVYVERDGDRVILRPKPRGWDDFFDRPVIVDDFMADRVDLPPQERDWS